MNNLDANSLIDAGREVHVPFSLAVTKKDGTSLSITITSILRLLPAKRVVAVAEVGDELVLVKIFIGRFAKRYCRRETAGVDSIEKTGVPTPAVKWQGRLASGQGFLVAFEYLPHALNLTDVWLDTDSHSERSGMLKDVMSVLAELHEGGVVQNDIHPENFLISEGRLYTIDGGAVSSHVDLSESKSLENLALFHAQFHAEFDSYARETLEVYRQHRHWGDDPDRLDSLLSLIRSQREQRKSDYIEKAFRECTRFSCHKTFSRYSVCERKFDSDWMKKLMQDPDDYMEQGTLLKDGNSATVVLIQAPFGPIVVKRYNIKGFGHLLTRLFRKSRAWKSWANTLRLEFLGISALKPVAMVEERVGPLRKRAYFITEYIEGPDATELLDDKDPADQMSSIAEILRKLSAARVTHGDLKASNFLLGSNGPVLIDLDSMTEHQSVASKSLAEKKDMERFMKNWESNPEIGKGFTELLG